MVNDIHLNGNGLSNGHCNGRTSTWVDENPEDIVLFTSESVGEGHPGKLNQLPMKRSLGIS